MAPSPLRAMWLRRYGTDVPATGVKQSLQEALDFPAASAVKVEGWGKHIVETVNGIMSINYEPLRYLR
jgi:hypothetical protein